MFPEIPLPTGWRSICNDRMIPAGPEAGRREEGMIWPEGSIRPETKQFRK
jgi:hypothetical protein